MRTVIIVPWIQHLRVGIRAQAARFTINVAFRFQVLKISSRVQDSGVRIP